MELPKTSTLLVALDGGVLRVTLNRPEARNAMTKLMVEELGAVFDWAAQASTVRAVVLRGAGGHFCAGGDLKEMMAGGIKPLAEGEADPIAANSRRYGGLLRQLATLPAVVIAICEGATLAGGFGLTCVSDIALAHVDTKFGVPETTRGLPPAQIAPFIVERIGLTAARRLCLTGAMFNGRQALHLGLVHETFEDAEQLDEKLSEILAQVLACAPAANAMTKAILLAAARADLDSVLDDAARKFASAVRGSEAPEGIAAFIQKRKPAWSR
jgi:isohexenylglutaconyl-CoA hydratase